MALPGLGSIDWKWLIIGILVDRFLIGFIMGLLSRARGAATPAASTATGA